MIIFKVFVGQKDEIRIDAAELLKNYEGQAGNKQVIDHIIDQVWIQYDFNEDGQLSFEESNKFLQKVLMTFQVTYSQTMGENLQEIKDEDIAKVFQEIDKNKDGSLTRAEV